MRFEEVLPALREGKKIRRKAYPPDYYICLEDNVLKVFISYLNRRSGGITIMTRDLLTDDWEIVKEIKKIKLRDLTEEQFEKWRDENCRKYDCLDCPFSGIDCNKFFRISCKDMYSDKFLDQEVEIED